MDKKHRNQIILSLIGMILSIGIGIFSQEFLTGVDKWLRNGITYFCCILCLGFLLSIFGGWRSFVKGCLFGFAFAFILFLLNKLPPPYDLISGGLLVVAELVVSKNRKRMHQKKKDAESPDLSPTVVEDYENEDDMEQTIPISSTGKFLIGSSLTTTSIYQIIKGQNGYYFIKIGNEFTSLNNDFLIDNFDDESKYDLGEEGFFISASEISKVQYKSGKTLAISLDHSGVLTLLTKKKRKFAVLEHVLPEAIGSFFDLVPQIELTKKKSDGFSAEQPLTDDELSLLAKLKKVCVSFFIALGGISICMFFFPSFLKVGYVLLVLSWLCLFFLCLKFDRLFSLQDFKRKQRVRVFQKDRINLLMPLMLLVFLMMGMLLKCNADPFYVWPLLPYAALLFLILLLLFLKYTTEYKKRGDVLLATILTLLFFSPLAVYQLNYALDYSAPIYAECPVVKKHTSTSSIPDYYITVELPDQKEFSWATDEINYVYTKIGDVYTIPYKKGFLGIYYAEKG